MTHPLKRLFGYARPYVGRLTWAFVGMVVTRSVGRPGVFTADFDSARPSNKMSRSLRGRSSLLRAQGHRFLRFVVLDGRCRPAGRHGLAQRVIPAHPRSSAGFFAHAAAGRSCPALPTTPQIQQAVSETAGDLARSRGRSRLLGAAVLLRCASHAALLRRRADHRLSAHPLGQRVRRTTSEAGKIEQLSHLGSEAFTVMHREGVRDGEA